MTTTTPATIALVLDCADPDRLASFWSEALGYTNAGSVGQYVALMPPRGSGAPKLLLQRVSEPKVAKNRMHFDIEHPDIETEAARLTQLGARRVREDVRREHGTSWILMEDPEGNEFCVCDDGAGSRDS
jgi:predicted enzyme related to lactoylglutathione lyase